MFDLIEAHKHCHKNRREIDASEICGCFYCIKKFPASEVVEWIDDGSTQTALCPHCSVDAVIGDKSGLLDKRGFLEEMHTYWFDPGYWRHLA